MSPFLSSAQEQGSVEITPAAVANRTNVRREIFEVISESFIKPPAPTSSSAKNVQVLFVAAEVRRRNSLSLSKRRLAANFQSGPPRNLVCYRRREKRLGSAG